jgi:hypothetical protein
MSATHNCDGCGTFLYTTSLNMPTTHQYVIIFGKRQDLQNTREFCKRCYNKWEKLADPFKWTEEIKNK